MRSLRSSALTLLAAFVALIGVGLATGAVVSAQWATIEPAAKAHFNAVNYRLVGYNGVAAGWVDTLTCPPAVLPDEV